MCGEAEVVASIQIVLWSQFQYTQIRDWHDSITIWREKVKATIIQRYCCEKAATYEEQFLQIKVCEIQDVPQRYTLETKSTLNMD